MLIYFGWILFKCEFCGPALIAPRGSKKNPMTNVLLHPLLQQPITTLGVSDAFVEMASVNGYETLADILHVPLYTLPLKPSSGYRMLRELITLLEGLAKD